MFINFNASLISLNEEAPVEIIIGFLVFAISLIKFKSVFSSDAILYNLGLNCFKKLRPFYTKGSAK